MNLYKKRVFVFVIIIILLLLILWLRHSDMITSNDETDNLFKVFIDWIMILFNFITLVLIVMQIGQTNIQVSQQASDLLEHKKEYLNQQKAIIIVTINYHEDYPIFMISNLGLVGAYNLTANLIYKDETIPLLFESKIKSELNTLEYLKIDHTIVLPQENITPYLKDKIKLVSDFEIIISYNDVHNQSAKQTIKKFTYIK